MTQYDKPLPPVDEDILPFWQAVKRHEFVLHRCSNCGAFYFPASYCNRCDAGLAASWAENMEWVKASGRGKILTFVVYHKVYNPTFRADVPYNFATVALDEGPLIVTDIVGCRNEEITIGMPVEVVFDDVTEDATLPRFKPVAQNVL